MQVGRRSLTDSPGSRATCGRLAGKSEHDVGLVLQHLSQAAALMRGPLVLGAWALGPGTAGSGLS